MLKTQKMNKRIEAWGERLGVLPETALKIVNMCISYHNACVLMHNEKNNNQYWVERSDKLAEQITKFLAEFGYSVRFDDGLWPVLTKDGLDYHLPD